MKNLHLIQPDYNLSDQELAVLAYVELGNEGPQHWQFKIENNKLYCRREGEINWELVLDCWTFPYVMRLWEQEGKFRPNMTKPYISIN